MVDEVDGRCVTSVFIGAYEHFLGFYRPLTVPLVQWIRGPLKPFLQETLMSAGARGRGIMRHKAILGALGREQLFGRDLWGALCLELWFKAFIEHSS